MMHTPGDDPASLLSRGLLDELDGTTLTPSRTPNPLGHHNSSHQQAHQFASPHPQYHPHQYQRAGILRDEDDHPELRGGHGRAANDDHPSSTPNGYPSSEPQRGFGRGPGPSSGGYYGGGEGSGSQQTSYQAQPTYALPPRHLSPPHLNQQAMYPQPGSASSSSNLLPFPADSDSSAYPSPSPYFPPAQYARPPDPLYSAQAAAQANMQQNQNQQQQYSLRQQQQSSHGQHQQQLAPQTVIPVTMANSLGLPVGMGGVNPMLGAQGRFPGGFTRPNGARGGESANQAAFGVGRGEVEEEISTVFVVGFPEDMQEREWQNMFTFCRDFEAATLKLPPSSAPSGLNSAAAGLNLSSGGSMGGGGPNADLNSYYYGSQSNFMDPASQFSQYQDPINPSGGPQGLAAFGIGPPAGNPAGRRQIIGFAKFRTRQAALDARDALQGRKVDVDRASVLKAEMAKKNLHTRRGVGGDDPQTGGGGGGPGGAGLVVGPSMSLGPMPGQGGGGPSSGPSGLSRGRTEGYPTGPGSSGFPGNDWSNTPSGINAPGQAQSSLMSSQPHSRAQSYPYTAHSFDLSHSDPSTGPASSHSSASDPSSPRYAPSSSQTETPMPPTVPQFDARASSQQRNYPLSPPSQPSYPLANGSPRFAREDDFIGSPPNGSFPGSLGKYPQQPQQQQQQQQGLRTRSLSRPQQSQPSRRGFDLSGSGVPEESADVFSDTENDSGEGRSGSGDPAPGSAGSSLGRAGGDKASKTLPKTSNPADMNPPINTLYVGNLPTSPPPTHPSSHLEDALRTLFSRCEGFRRMSFRQKSNGPMCFVEFEDVATASVALRDLYGDSLGGFVKGGIRLSYSKHPLGQRGPATTAASAASSAPSTSNTTTSGLPAVPSNNSSSGPSSPPRPGVSSPIEMAFPNDSSASSSHHALRRHNQHASLSPPTSFASGLPLPVGSASSRAGARQVGSSIYERHSSPPNPEYLSSSSQSHSTLFGSSPSTSAASPRGMMSTSVHQDWKGSMGTFSPFGGEVESG